jgi:SAM-dependent methyltransferase
MAGFQSNASPPKDSAIQRDVSSISGRISQAFYRLQAKELVNSLVILPGTRVLDLGCGSGFLKPIFEARNAIYNGIDSDSKSIMIARQLYGHKGFRCGYFPEDVDVTDVDFVISLSCIDEVEDPLASLKAIASLIAPTNGHAVIAVRNASFPIYSLKQKLHRAGLKRPAAVEDATYGHWVALMDTAGLRIVEVKPYYRPWFIGVSLSGAKNAVYRIANWFLPTPKCYMLQFSLTRL